jgi:uncharacterized sulfatase
MLGEHNLMGHGFQVYQELVHVPMVVRFPGQHQGERVDWPISTLQVFHTIMDVANVNIGIGQHERRRDGSVEDLPSRVERLSLRRVSNKRSGSVPVVSEAYPPQNVIKILENRAPKLIDRHKSRSTFRAVYDRSGYKLVRGEKLNDRLYNLIEDPAEINPLTHPADNHHGKYLLAWLENFLNLAEARRPENWTRRGVDYLDDKVAQRLRALGYLE